jgi:hypothetical protein
LGFTQPNRLTNFKNDEIGSLDGDEGDKPDSLRKQCGTGIGNRDREPGLADTAGSGKREQALTLVNQQLHDGVAIRVTADKRSARAGDQTWGEGS